MASRRAKIAFALLAALLLTGAVAVTLLRPGHAESSLIREAKSWSEVKDYQYEKTPGLERAEKLGLARQLGQVADVPDAGTSVRFDEAWYNSKHIYLFYSMPINSLPEEGQVPQLSFRVGTEGAVPDTEQPYTLSWTPEEGVYYEGRLYGRLVVYPFGQEGKPLDRVDRLIVSGIAIRRGGEDVGAASGPLLLDVGYDAANERSETIPLGQTYEALNRKIELVRLEMGTSVNRLFFRYDGEASESFYFADAALRSDRGERRSGSMNGLPKDGVYELDFDPFNVRPAKISIEWQGVRTYDKELSFRLKLDADNIVSEASQEQGSWSKRTDEPIGSLLNTDIRLEELFYDERGLNVTIRYDADASQQKPYLRLYPEMPNSLPQELAGEERERWIREQPELLRVTNENGEEGEFGQTGAGSGARFNAFIDKAFFDRSKQVTVEAGNLVVEWTFDWQTDIAVPAGE